MARAPKVIAGIAWFRSDQWELLRSLAADAEKLETTHAEWEAAAGKAIRDLARRGVSVRKVNVDVNELHAWCITQARPLDGSARAAYAMAQLPASNERT
jgi:hypothetical protein